MADGAKKRTPNVLSIAGVDPSGGAGVFADIKAMSACGAYACGVVTAITAQNTRGVFGVENVSCGFIRRQLDVLFDDVEIDAVKIGMLGSRAIIETVAAVLTERRPEFVVLDPVMVAKSKDRLLAKDAVSALREALLPLAAVITPNLPEAAELLGRGEPKSREEMAAAAAELSCLLVPGRGWVLLKGGHLVETASSDDLLLGPAGEARWLPAERIRTKNTHGTGCTYSSALAALLPQSESVPAAAEKAKRYVTGAIRHAEELAVGNGHGPTHHFWMTVRPQGGRGARRLGCKHL